jgi:hypothetical protein
MQHFLFVEARDHNSYASHLIMHQQKLCTNLGIKLLCCVENKAPISLDLVTLINYIDLDVWNHSHLEVGGFIFCIHNIPHLLLL